MRVKFEGNHSAYHSGCVAVWEALMNAARELGVTIVDADEEYDLLVMNGEGSMHHGRPTFHKKMNSLAAAIKKGRRAMLVNSLWQNNPSTYDPVLQKIEPVWTRDILSLRALEAGHGIEGRLCLDFSYFADVVEEPGDTDNIYDNKIVRTDYYSKSNADFADFSELEISQYQRISMRGVTWSQFVSRLRTASLLVTGRHHAVYAALRARTPFAAVEGNSHKIRGLIASSGVNIPVADRQSDIPELIEWASTHSEEYERLFDWVEEFAQETSPKNVLSTALR